MASTTLSHEGSTFSIASRRRGGNRGEEPIWGWGGLSIESFCDEVVVNCICRCLWMGLATTLREKRESYSFAVCERKGPNSPRYKIRLREEGRERDRRVGNIENATHAPREQEPSGQQRLQRNWYPYPFCQQANALDGIEVEYLWLLLIHNSIN